MGSAVRLGEDCHGDADLPVSRLDFDIGPLCLAGTVDRLTRRALLRVGSDGSPRMPCGVLVDAPHQGVVFSELVVSRGAPPLLPDAVHGGLLRKVSGSAP